MPISENDEEALRDKRIEVSNQCAQMPGCDTGKDILDEINCSTTGDDEDSDFDIDDDNIIKKIIDDIHDSEDVRRVKSGYIARTYKEPVQKMRYLAMESLTIRRKLLIYTEFSEKFLSIITGCGLFVLILGKHGDVASIIGAIFAFFISALSFIKQYFLSDENIKKINSLIKMANDLIISIDKYMGIAEEEKHVGLTPKLEKIIANYEIFQMSCIEVLNTHMHRVDSDSYASTACPTNRTLNQDIKAHIDHLVTKTLTSMTNGTVDEDKDYSRASGQEKQ